MNRVFLSLRIVAFISFLSFFVNSQSAYAQVVAYDLTSSNAATAGIAANYPGQGRVMNIVGITQSGSYSSTNGQTCYSWNAVGTDAWATSVFSTEGYINITGSFQMKANTNLGPRDFKIQYSLDGSSWTDASSGATVTLTNSLTTYNFTLPTACENKSSMYVRWVLNSLIRLDGGTLTTSSSYNASLKGVSIAGDAFASPSTQSSLISIVSVTPTTIKITCTNGNGNNRLIKINTTNSFTNPVDDDYPSANSTYAGSGEQVIYNGSGSGLTVTVPSSTNEYWFRVYEFNKMDNLTRFNTDEASGNPKQCKLETIHSPTYADIRLTTATLGATIQTPTTGTIVERGIFWSTSSPVDETSNLYGVQTTNGGVYAISGVPVERGATIYFKGYVTNESGTIMSEESSFSNIPVFTGTGTWETAARWNVLQVPGLTGDEPDGGDMDSPVINGTCTMTLNNTVDNLTINSGSRVLNINPEVSLTVNSTLTNNSGTSGLVIKSDASGTGSLMHNTDNVNATVQRYISGTSELTAKKYHLVSVPINSETYLSGVWLHSYLFTYVESSDTWFNWDTPTVNILNTNEGAMVYYPNYEGTSYKIYNITGQLNNGSYTPQITVNGNGYNLVPNPYPSAMDWDAVTQTNVDNAIWIFNPAGPNYGSYIDGVSTNGVTNIIPVGQAFFVKASDAGLTFDNGVRLHNHTAFMKGTRAVANVFHLKAIGNDGSDEIAVRFVDDATNGYDKKYDAVKFSGDSRVPQLSSFTETDNTFLSVNATRFTDGVLSIPLVFAMNYTGEVTFVGSGFETFENMSVRLEDKLLNKIVKLDENPVYTFQQTPTSDSLRFMLHFVSTVGTGEQPANGSVKMYTVNKQLYVSYVSEIGSSDLTVYDVQGREVARFSLSGDGTDTFALPVSQGVYFAKLSGNTVSTFKIFVR